MKTTKPTVASLSARIEELETLAINAAESIQALTARVAELEARPARGVRNYGPKSENSMTEESAWRILYGDLSATKVKDIADQLGLSRGQVYSVKGGYTFTRVKEDDFSMDFGEVVRNES